MIITEKAKKFIKENMGFCDAIFVNVRNECCSVGEAIHIGFVESKDFKNIIIINDVKVCYDSLAKIENLIIDYDGISFTYEELK